MRRYDMVKKLEKAIDSALGNDGKNILYPPSKYLAYLVLKLCEDSGMLPPERYRDHDWNKKGITYSEWLQLSSKVNKWEEQ